MEVEETLFSNRFIIYAFKKGYKENATPHDGRVWSVAAKPRPAPRENAVESVNIKIGGLAAQPASSPQYQLDICLGISGHGRTDVCRGLESC